MINWLFRRPLELEVGEKTVRFATLADFEFCLASRTEVPAGKVGELVKLPLDALKAEARSIGGIEKSYVDLLAQSIQSPERIGGLFAELDTQSISSDHEWRSMMVGLKTQGARFNEFKQVALVKYMQYLRSRQDVLKSIYYEKKRGQPHSSADADLETQGETAFRETVMFDSSQLEVRVHDNSRFVQLPKGESVERRLSAGKPLDLMLSRHLFRLEGGASPVALVDTHGTSFRLASGRNIVGRHQGNHVVVDPGFRDISRKHLIIETLGADRVRLTDLSSHGTYVELEASAA